MDKDLSKDKNHKFLMDFLKTHSHPRSQESIKKVLARKERRAAMEQAIKDNGYTEAEAEAFKMGIIWQQIYSAKHENNNINHESIDSKK